MIRSAYCAVCYAVLQVFVKGEFIGGSDILMEMHKAGELQQLAEELGTVSK